MRCFEVELVSVFLVAVAAGGTVILWQLQNHMCCLRRSKPEINVPRFRPTDVFGHLTGIIWIVGIAILYFLFVHRLPGRHLSP